MNIILKPGEKITIQKGEAHRFYNSSNQPIKFNLQFTPGHTGAENMLRILYGLACDGMTNKKGIPKFDNCCRGGRNRRLLRCRYPFIHLSHLKIQIAFQSD